jgi:hypothetical protein
LILITSALASMKQVQSTSSTLLSPKYFPLPPCSFFVLLVEDVGTVLGRSETAANHILFSQGNGSTSWLSETAACQSSSTPQPSTRPEPPSLPSHFICAVYGLFLALHPRTAKCASHD